MSDHINCQSQSFSSVTYAPEFSHIVQSKWASFLCQRVVVMIYKGILFNLAFIEGEGNVANMPTHGGIYAEVHWPTRSI